MVASPGETCDCQNYCETDLVQSALHIFGDNDFCFKLRDRTVGPSRVPQYSRILIRMYRLNHSDSSLAVARRISAMSRALRR